MIAKLQYLGEAAILEFAGRGDWGSMKVLRELRGQDPDVGTSRWMVGRFGCCKTLKCTCLV